MRLEEIREKLISPNKSDEDVSKIIVAESVLMTALFGVSYIEPLFPLEVRIPSGILATFLFFDMYRRTQALRSKEKTSIEE